MRTGQAAKEAAETWTRYCSGGAWLLPHRVRRLGCLSWSLTWKMRQRVVEDRVAVGLIRAGRPEGAIRSGRPGLLDDPGGEVGRETSAEDRQVPYPCWLPAGRRLLLPLWCTEGGQRTGGEEGGGGVESGLRFGGICVAFIRMQSIARRRLDTLRHHGMS